MSGQGSSDYAPESWLPAPDPGYVYGDVLPLKVAKGPNGLALPGATPQLAIPGMVRGAVNGLAMTLAAPENAARGKYSPQDMEQIAPVMTGTMLGLGVGAPEVEGGENVFRMFGGIGAKTADTTALKSAQSQYMAGATAEKIWNSTGWFKDVDGQWKFEIPDSGAQLHPSIPGSAPADAVDLSKLPGKSLGEVIKHPGLFQAYPELGSTMVLPAPKGVGYAGSAAGGVMELAPQSREDMLSTVLHETQHMIQGKEGFATGGSTAEFLPQNWLQSKRQASSQHMANLSALKAVGLPPAKIVTALAKNLVNPELLNNDDIELLTTAQTKEPRLLNSVNNTVLQLHSLESTRQAAVDKYYSLAGEVEARNVEERKAQGLGPETPPWQTQGYPEGQQIVRGVGAPANALAAPAQAIRGYHGTPYEFEPVEGNPFGAFQNQAIGSGEGAQVYGWGHYVAGEKQVAEEYQKQLSGDRNPTLMLNGKPVWDYYGAIGDPGKEPIYQQPEPVEEAAKAMHQASGDLKQAKVILQTKVDDPAQGALNDPWITGRQARNLTPSYLSAMQQNSRDALEYLNQNPTAMQMQPRGGNLYHVEIRPDEHELLDWDRPISQQNPQVLSTLRSITHGGLDESATGAEFYQDNAHHGFGDQSNLTSEWLHNAGVPGVKYLDQGSRELNSAHGGVEFHGENLTGPNDLPHMRWSAVTDTLEKHGAETDEDSVSAADSALSLAHKYGNVKDTADAVYKNIVKLHNEREQLNDPTNSVTRSMSPKSIASALDLNRRLMGSAQDTAEWLDEHGEHLSFAPPKKGTSNYVIFHPDNLKIVGRNGVELPAKLSSVEHDPFAPGAGASHELTPIDNDPFAEDPSK